MKILFKSKNARSSDATSTPPRPLAQNNRLHEPPRSQKSAGSSVGKPTTGSPTTLERTVPAPKPDKVNGELLKTHIEVCVRVRPLEVAVDGQGYFAAKAGRLTMNGVKSMVLSRRNDSGVSGSKSDGIVAWDVSSDEQTAAQSPHIPPVPGRTNSYTLDHVYGPEATTKQIHHRSIKSLVDRAMEGYHSSILAYGQSGAGKTFTMTGTRESPGLIPMAIADCFRYVQKSQESREYLIRISYLEIYKENIRDLLNPTPQPIRLFDGPNGLVIRGLKEEIVSTPEHVYTILTRGERRRQVGATHLNQHSSRSHVILRLWIESTTVGSDTTRVSSLSLVDLAGSESVKLNGTDRREEGHYINKSLMTLGQVVLSLSEGKTGHIPYRDSKLTRLLEPSLSGNAQMVLLCCISPQTSHLEESHNTFKFASRAKKVEQKAIVNVAEDEQTLLQTYKSEIENLRKQLAEAKEQQDRLLQEKTKSTGDDVTISTDVTDGEIRELVEAIKTMERLILKSKPHQELRTPSSSEDDLDFLLKDDSEDDKDDEDLLIEVSSRTPAKSDEDALHKELNRIRGLLGSVLEKRGVAPPSPDCARRLLLNTPSRSPEEVHEVATLRKQLEQQEVTTNLRKADSSFLQSQLQEKDKLLEEVYTILDALEARQNELEKENATLRAQVETMQRGK